MNSNETSTENNPKWSGLVKLLYPGIGIKRWLLIGGAGVAIWSIGVAFLLRKIFDVRFPEFLPSHLEGIVLVICSISLISLSVVKLYKSIGPIVLSHGNIDSLAETIYARRSRGRGPKIVAIGGGTGLSVLLSGLKAYTDNLTAIITVSDDGGSSGRLRRELGVLPPGDFRNCIVAMSNSESLLPELFQYRFSEGDGLKGHSFGNLFIVAMSNITKSFDQALIESSRVLAVHGQILPSTVANVKLSAQLSDGNTIQGESKITEYGGQIERLSIHPSDVEAYGTSVDAILEAQMIIIGPGSLYTSILPNLCVPGISEALNESTAQKVYVCNVATQEGETSGYSVADHLEAIQRHTSNSLINFVIANSDVNPDQTKSTTHPVINDERPLVNAVLERSDLVDPDYPLRHDPKRLAEAIISLYDRSVN